MVARQLTADEFAGWLMPSQAVEILKGKYASAHLAKETLLGRLTAGVALAACRKVVTKDEGRMHSGEFLCMGIDDWSLVSTDNNFWITGDLVRSRRTSTFDSTISSYFDVRFEPDGVHAIVAPLLGAGSAGPRPPFAAPAADPNQKGPRVSDAHLQAWFAFYKAVTPITEDTEDYAWTHARRCFPEKTVSRERVRDLRGSHKRGPKTKST
jgi:hypothetical protein